MAGWVKTWAYNTYKAGAEAILPPLTQSQFKEKGVLTHEEFVAAGDYLVRTCPTWAWDGGDPKKQNSNLPPEKQYLITRNVPCLQRASAVAHYASDIASGGGGEEVEGGEWVAASGEEDEAFEELPATGHQGPVKDIGGDDDDEADRPSSGASGPEGTAEEAVLDISNLDLDEDDDAVAPAAAAAPVAASSAVQAAAVSQPNVVQTRTYDLIISYDKYYHVPRVWLVGYAEDRTPLTPDEIFEDVINDYYTHRDRKTVSVEDHPHRAEGGKVVSIHPCRHADVMKKLTGVVAGETADFKVDHYMVLFLKFISSVVPTIEYDFTMPAGM